MGLPPPPEGIPPSQPSFNTTTNPTLPPPPTSFPSLSSAPSQTPTTMGKSDKRPRQRPTNFLHATARPFLAGRSAHSLSTRIVPEPVPGLAMASSSASQLDTDKVSKERYERKAQQAAARAWDASQDKKEKDAINRYIEVSRRLHRCQQHSNMQGYRLFPPQR